MKRFKKTLSYLLCLVLMFLLFPTSVFASEPNPEDPINPVYEEKVYCNATIEDSFDGSSVLVVMDKAVGGINKVHEKEFFGDFPIEEIIDLTYITVDTSDALINEEAFRQILQIKLPEDSKENVLWVIHQLEQVEGIISAEPDYIWEDPFALTTPNDPGFVNGNQRGLTKIQAPYAWDTTKGSTNVHVGIMDSGISSHSDLSANVATGWDFYNNNNVTSDDPTGHGTQVAGVIGAVGNNNQGVAGVCWNVTLVPLQIVDASGNAPTSCVTAATTYAINNNIPILNCSFGNKVYDNACRQAILNYTGLFVCAAGNGMITLLHLFPPYPGTNNDTDPFYPASYSLTNIISVANTTTADNLDYTSNYGATTVHLAAPGTDIYSTFPSNTYVYDTGTSFSAPYVAGVAALIRSANPYLSTGQIKDCILSTVDQVSALQNNTITGGRLNAYKAVQKALIYNAGWVIINGERFYYNSNGQMLLGWQLISGYQYYFRPSANNPSAGSKGSAVTGWQTISGSKYYFDNNGRMLTGSHYIDGYWYRFDLADGKQKFSWQFLDGDWYYYETTYGRLLFGSQYIDGYWYRFDLIDAKQKFGSQFLDGKWYYYDTYYGRMLFGFQYLDGYWYYYHPNEGYMFFGSHYINGQWYYFDPVDGKMQ